MQNTLASPTIQIKQRARTNKDPFFLIMSILALFVVIVGFFPSYVSPMMKNTFVATPWVHLHGFVFFVWILMCIAQPVLVQRGDTRFHKKLGLFMAVFAGFVVIMGVTIAISSAHVDLENGRRARAVSFLLRPLTDMLLFSLFIGLALYYRKSPEKHKRLMLLATVAILTAPIARLLALVNIDNIFLHVLIRSSFVFAAIAYDLIRYKSVHKVYVLGGALILIVHYSRVFLGRTEGWISMAEWILG